MKKLLVNAAVISLCTVACSKNSTEESTQHDYGPETSQGQTQNSEMNSAYSDSTASASDQPATVDSAGMEANQQ